MKKNMKIYQNNKGFEQIYSFITLIYFGKTMVLRKKTKHKYYKKKPMVLYRKLWNFDLLWKKNYGTIENFS